MKKNGFIATSLIYSFFLIFITLFLTIIADYLQNKVLLNTIEKGIKDEINDSMGIRDFEVGDMISFIDDCSNVAYISNQWVVANVNYIDKKIIFYSYDFDGDNGPSGFTSTTAITKDNIENDIEFGYRNTTYFNKILYTFQKNVSGTLINEYSIGNGSCISINCTGTTTGEFDYGKNCIKTCTSSNTRKRLEKIINNTKYKKCVSETSGDGVIILEV